MLRFVLVLVLTASIVLAGCGDDDCGPARAARAVPAAKALTAASMASGSAAARATPRWRETGDGTTGKIVVDEISAAS